MVKSLSTEMSSRIRTHQVWEGKVFPGCCALLRNNQIDIHSTVLPVKDFSAKRTELLVRMLQIYLIGKCKEIKPFAFFWGGVKFPGDLVFKNPPANAGDIGSIPGLGRFHMPQSN